MKPLASIFQKAHLTGSSRITRTSLYGWHVLSSGKCAQIAHPRDGKTGMEHFTCALDPNVTRAQQI